MALGGNLGQAAMGMQQSGGYARGLGAIQERLDRERMHRIESLISRDDEANDKTKHDDVLVSAHAALYWDSQAHTFAVKWDAEVRSFSLTHRVESGNFDAPDYPTAKALAEAKVAEAVTRQTRKLLRATVDDIDRDGTVRG